MNPYTPQKMNHKETIGIDQSIPWIRKKYKAENFKNFLNKDLTDSQFDALSNLAHVIEAPDSLHGFVPALEAFYEVLPSLIDCPENNNNAIFKGLLSQLGNFFEVGVFSDVDDELQSKNIRTLCGTHPFYAVLIGYDEFRFPEALKSNFIALFYANYIKRWDKVNVKLKERAGLAVRSTLNGKGFSISLFQDFCDSLDMIDSLSLAGSLSKFEYELLDSESDVTYELPKASTQYLRTLSLLFFGELGVKKGGGGGKRRQHYGATRLPNLPFNQQVATRFANTIDTEDSEEDYELGCCYLHQDINEDKKQDSHKFGLALGDITSEIEAITEEISSHKKAALVIDKQRMKLRTKQIASGIASENQFLPTQWGQLNSYDIYILVKELITLCDSHDDSYGVPAPLLAAAIGATFTRGNALEHVLKTLVIRKKIKGASNHVVLHVKDGEWIAIWNISGVLNIANSHKFINKTPGYSRESEKNTTLALTVPKWIANLLGRADVARKKLKLSKRNRKLFPNSGYAIAVKKWLVNIRKKYPACRLTLSRIERFYVQFCIQLSGYDLAETAYTHGNIQVIQETQLYYSAIPKEKIESIYKNIWIQIESLIQKESMKIEGKNLLIMRTEQLTIDIYGNEKAFIGSKITPTSKAVSDLVLFLQHEMSDSKHREQPRWKKLIDFHNAFTTYTMLFLAFSSGYRATVDPFPDPRFLDEKTGFLVISDKDFNDGYCTRIIWLNSECIKQIKFYRVHLELIVNRLCLVNNQSFQDINASFEGWDTMPERPKQKMRMESGMFQIPHFIFFLDDNGHCRSVTPKELSARIKSIYPLPLNSNRHYLRTMLIEHKCSVDIIDAFMGHWHRGRESWGQFSSLSPHGYARKISPILENIICENGWKAIESIET